MFSFPIFACLIVASTVPSLASLILVLLKGGDYLASGGAGLDALLAVKSAHISGAIFGLSFGLVRKLCHDEGGSVGGIALYSIVCLMIDWLVPLFFFVLKIEELLPFELRIIICALRAVFLVIATGFFLEIEMGTLSMLFVCSVGTAIGIAPSLVEGFPNLQNYWYLILGSAMAIPAARIPYSPNDFFEAPPTAQGSYDKPQRDATEELLYD